MSKKEIIKELSVSKTIYPNKGVCFDGDNIVYVKGAIPGQKLELRIKKKRKKYEGQILNIIEKSPVEIDIKCSHFGKCGGCTYQNIPYEKELEIKEKNVYDLLIKNNISEFNFLPIKKSPIITGYRNKMEYSFGDTSLDGELSLGMRKKDSYYEVVTTKDCNIVHNDFTEILLCVLNFFKDSDEKFYHKSKHTGSLRHLVLRRGHFTNELLVNLVTTDSLLTDLTPLTEKLNTLKLNGKIVGILHTINNSLSDAVKIDELKLLYGRDYFFDELLGLKFKISPFSFFQTNSSGAEILYSTVKEFVGDTEDKTIFDLYCGTGTIAQIMSNGAKKVTGIEIISEAIDAAKENAELNTITNCKFIAGDVLEYVDTLKDSPDIIILDPPRDGIHPKAIDKILAFNPKKFIYVSCKASSMVRDLPFFLEKGYKIEKIQCVDMFPRTYHVETVVLLSK